MKMWWTDKRLSVLMISLTQRRGEILALILLVRTFKEEKKVTQVENDFSDKIRVYHRDDYVSNFVLRFKMCVDAAYFTGTFVNKNNERNKFKLFS